MIRQILKKPFVKFLFVGGINTAFGYLTFALIIFFVKSLYISVVLSNIIGVIFNFNTYGRLVFYSKDNSRIFRFIVAYLIIMLLQISLIKVLIGVGIPNNYIAAAIILLPMAALSFLLLSK